ncbi:tyrosine-type recombinase/integrase [Escherichia albertii]|nr:site-specific integrase [Escherichia albertii]
MQYKRDRYLTFDRSGVYLVRISIPVYMRQHFNGKRNYIRSTGARDIREARLMRDAIALEFFKVREELRPKPSGTRIEIILNEIKSIGKYAKENPLYLGAPIETCPSLLKMRDIYLLQYSSKRKLTTLSKCTKAVDQLLEHVNRRDVQLKEINRTVVTGWLDKLKPDKAPQTMQNYISSLAQIYDLARNRYHDAPQDNPFKGHKLEVKGSKISYEPFTAGELAKVYNCLNDEMQSITLIGMHSGMRLNEIASLRTGNIKTVEDVLCFEITEGKTKNAARYVPVHPVLIDLVESLIKGNHEGFLFYHASITDRADGKLSTWHTQQFTRAKRKALGEVGTERKVFHSLRGMFITQLDRAKVPEDRIALIVGHERGNTESFKTYSKGASLEELRGYINQIAYKLT